MMTVVVMMVVSTCEVSACFYWTTQRIISEDSHHLEFLLFFPFVWHSSLYHHVFDFLWYLLLLWSCLILIVSNCIAALLFFLYNFVWTTLRYSVQHLCIQFCWWFPSAGCQLRFASRFFICIVLGMCLHITVANEVQSTSYLLMVSSFILLRMRSIALWWFWHIQYLWSRMAYIQASDLILLES